MPADELLRFLSDELGAPACTSKGLGSALRRLRGRLADCATRGERPLLVIDEAHLIDEVATFEALRAVLNFASLGPPDVRMVLVASPDLLPRLPQGLADRLTARCLLGPLTRSEAATYVHGRLSAAGAREPLFTPEAIAVLHRASEGLPRRLNRLADLSLLISYAEGLPCPGTRAVAAAAREVEFDVLAA
jgi:type II secretory pathway predicted ATPase ExeA